jgi:hypothetical protein
VVEGHGGQLGRAPADRPKVGWATRGGERRRKGEERPWLGHAKLGRGGKRLPKRGGGQAGSRGRGAPSGPPEGEKGERKGLGFFLFPPSFSPIPYPKCTFHKFTHPQTKIDA